MKAILIFILVLFSATVGICQEWHTANQGTFFWEQISPPVDDLGNILPGEIKYQVFLKYANNGVTVPMGDPVSETKKIVTFKNEGNYFLCVQSLRYVPGEAVPVGSSEIACTDVAQNCVDDVAFGVKYFVLPEKVGGLGLQK